MAAAHYRPIDLPPDTVLCVGASVTIHAPAAHVFELFAAPATWPEWNSFTPSATVSPPASIGGGSAETPLSAGTKMAVHVRMIPSAPLITQKMLVTAIDRDLTLPDGQVVSRACWKAQGMPEFMLRANRTSQCRDTGSADSPLCEFVTFDVMAGPAAYAVKAMFGSVLQSRFEDMARELKVHAEATYQR